MNRSKIYDAIIQIAKREEKNNGVLSRADVAFELKSEGVKRDSFLVENLINEAFELADKETQKAFKKVFYNNRLTATIIDENGVYALLKKDNFQAALQLVVTKIDTIHHSMNEASRMLELVHNHRVTSGFLDSVSGSSQIDRIKKEGESLYQTYQNSINEYAKIKNSILNLIDDFVLLRSEILKKYREGVTQLTDVFGERIKSVAPHLFDFNSIEWLHTDKMLADIQFEFENLAQTCTQMMREIREKFTNNISASMRLLGRGGGRTDWVAAMTMAGLNLLNAQIEARNKATQLRQELEKMRQNMNYDMQSIQADLSRLNLIDKRLKDVYIPVAQMFDTHFNQVYSREFENFLKTFYNNPKIAVLQQKKKELLQRYQVLEAELIDHRRQISNYQSMIVANEKQLTNYTPIYLEAKRTKPSKPFFLFNWLTFNSMGKSYNRDINEWYQDYGYVIEAYCSAKEDLRIDKEELASHIKASEELELKSKQLLRDVEKQSVLINKQIENDSDLHTKMAKHLTPLINLLRMARKIAEFKIEEQYLRTVRFEKIHVQILPNEIEGKITHLLRDLNVKVTKGIQNEISDFVVSPSEHALTTPQNQAQITQMINQNVHELMNSTNELIENTLHLRKLKIAGAIMQEHYENELSKLRKQFNQEISVYDHKGRIIKGVINSNSEKNIKEALLMLIDEKDDFWTNEQEVIGLLKENKDISL